MSSINPYEASQVAQSPTFLSAAPGMSAGRGIAIVAATMGACAAFGALVGWCLGVFAPDYYHAVFDNPTLNTAQVGIGLGLTQGLGTGLVVGCVALLGMAISSRRRVAA
ncbi:MAG: hypothetical protein SFU86_05025 [Pirellulaceae bacterium]|nr:hypothetical protein [Pirellulaceae bacterium]